MFYIAHLLSILGRALSAVVMILRLRFAMVVLVLMKRCSDL